MRWCDSNVTQVCDGDASKADVQLYGMAHEMVHQRTPCNRSILSYLRDVCGVRDAALTKGFPRTLLDTQPKNARVQESHERSRLWKRSSTDHGLTLVLAALGTASTSAGIGAAVYREQFEKPVANIDRAHPVLGTALQR
jgi:hypothetical protein